MTGNLPLDWALQAVSVFNAILAAWLGLTILLNAERRVWGIWVTGCGLLAASLFFVSHSIILSEGFNLFSRRVDLWWHIGWWPVVLLPLVWYVVTLWYGGFWEPAAGEPGGLRRRQRWPFALTLVMAGGLGVLLLIANPLPSLAVDLRYAFDIVPLVAGVPLLVAAYPIYILLCIGLSFDALLRPGPSQRLMGDLARRRARPWLLGTAAALLAVSLMVAWVMLWVVENASDSLADITRAIAWVDLLVAAAIAAAVLCVGQAVVVYEVFTGKALPRHGLQRHWRRVIVLAAGLGGLISGGLTLDISPIYEMVSITALITVFLALFSWRIFGEREHYMRQLRPFVASQRLYDHLLTPPSGDGGAEVGPALRALADEVLGAADLILAPLGPLAPLAGPPVSASGALPSLPPLAEVTARLDLAQTMYLPVDPARFSGAEWAVPLWSERGLIGLLLLGAKRDGSLYTQEEIELARASGERLIDTRASAEMARRLVGLQRRRLAESQVLDRRTRQVLHDDILPQLHAVMLTLNGPGFDAPATAEVLAAMTGIHRRMSDLLHELPAAAPDVVRLGLPGALEALARGELAGAFDQVVWRVSPEAGPGLASLPQLAADVVFHAAREAMRNAAKHGRGADGHAPLTLTVSVDWPGGLRLAVEDDGVGVEERPAGPALNGSGSGLALHSTLLAVVGGTLSVEPGPRGGTRVVLWLPAGQV